MEPASRLAILSFRRALVRGFRAHYGDAEILVVTVYLSFTKSIYTSEEMKALVFAPVTSRWPDPPITIFSAPPEEEAKRD